MHSPFSGQGLNLGVGDAINLGWKLAATIRGWAPAGLLDTYTAERHPIGSWVLDWTRAQVALMRGDAKTRELRDVVAQHLLATPEGMTRIVKLASGIEQHYTLDGSDTAAGVDTDVPAGTELDGRNGAGPARVGRLLGDVALADGSRLADHAHGGTFVLLDRTPGRTLTRTTEPWHDRVTTVTDAVVDTVAGGGPVGLLVRPDGVVVWVADGGITDTGALPPGLERVLLRWAGSPTTIGARR